MAVVVSLGLSTLIGIYIYIYIYILLQFVLKEKRVVIELPILHGVRSGIRWPFTKSQPQSHLTSPTQIFGLNGSDDLKDFNNHLNLVESHKRTKLAL